LRAALASLLALCLSCSWIAVRGPTKTAEPLDCNDSPGAVVADEIALAAGLVMVAAGAFELAAPCTGECWFHGIGAVPLGAGAVIAVPAGLSLYHGKTEGDRCQEARWAARREREMSAYAPAPAAAPTSGSKPLAPPAGHEWEPCIHRPGITTGICFPGLRCRDDVCRK
jgi:hypothetical protein